MQRWLPTVLACAVILVATVIGGFVISDLVRHVDTVAACRSGDVMKLRDVEIALVHHSLHTAAHVYHHGTLLRIARREAAYEIRQLRSVHC